MIETFMPCSNVLMQNVANEELTPLAFIKGVEGEKRKRDAGIAEAIERWGYSGGEVANHLGLYYSTVSRLINEGCQNIKIKDLTLSPQGLPVTPLRLPVNFALP